MRSSLHHVIYGSIALVVITSAEAQVQRTWDEAHALASTYVSKMTLDQKVAAVRGVGQFSGPCVGTTTAAKNSSSTIFPAICFQDGPAGLRAVDDYVSAFPAGITVAATFDRSLMRARGVAIGEEWRGKGAHTFLGPALDVTRAPEAGRAWESFGADPYLNGEAGYETIMGVQSKGVQACAKHFIHNNQEQYRFTSSSDVDDKTTHEHYWPPFQRAIDAGVTCVMCAYNKNNDTYSCTDPALIGNNGLLRREGGFRGYVLSDWGATHGTVNETVSAGLDVEMPGDWILIGGGVYNGLKAAVNSGAITAASLDAMVTRMVAGWLKVGQDSGYPATNFNGKSNSGQTYTNVRTDAHVALIRQIGAASAVLLKNTKNALPLATPATMAVVGLDAAPIASTGCDLNACNLGGTTPVGWGSGTNVLKNVVAPIIALQNAVSAQGNKTKIISSLTQDTGAAVKAATGASVALVFVYTFSGEIGGGLTNVDGNYGDRSNLNLWKKGGSLVEAVAAVNPNTIVVVHSVGSVVMGPWADNPNVTAIISAGLPGSKLDQRSLMSYTAQSSRLPYTIPFAEADFNLTVVPYDIFGVGFEPDIPYTERLLTDYTSFDSRGIAPRYEFGFGLSYTKFSYSSLKISTASSRSRRQTGSSSPVAYTVSFTVQNTGSRNGKEIAQVYIGFPSGYGEPPRLLKGFEAVTLAAGASGSVSIGLTQRDLQVWDVPSQSWIRPTGSFNVFVGASSRDIRLTGAI